MYFIDPRFTQRIPSLLYSNEFDTLDTTRVNFSDIYNFNAAVTKIIYPNKSVGWRPHAVILVPQDKWQYAACASSIVHFPINAPIMFTERYHLPFITLNEILRLDPTGEKVPGKILIIGPISQVVENQLRMAGLTTYRITNSDDVYKACHDIGNFRLKVVPPTSEDGNKDVIVISGEDYVEGITSTFYAAHKGTPIVLVQQNRIPDSIKNFIVNNRDKNYYILGTTRTVDESVENEIKNTISGNVERISGTDPYSISVNFAKYESPIDMFGWKRNKKDGWAFTFCEFKKWHHIISGVLFAHLGKHTPMLMIDKNKLPKVVRDYVIAVNPHKPMPDMPPYMHSYILGSLNDISFNTKVEIEKIINIESEMAH